VNTSEFFGCNQHSLVHTPQQSPQPGTTYEVGLVKDWDTLIEQSNKWGTQNNSQKSSLWQIYEANKDSET